MSKERYVEHTVALELPIRDSVTKGNYNLADIETKYLPIQTEVVSDNKDKTINKLQQQIAELKQQLAELKQQLNSQSEEIVEKIYKYLTQEENWKKLRKAWLNNGECEYLRKSLDTILKEYQK